MSAPDPNSAASPPDLKRLRRRFIVLIVATAGLAVLAVLFALAHYVFHQSWGLPAFAVILAAAFAVQIRFVWLFRKDAG